MLYVFLLCVLLLPQFALGAVLTASNCTRAEVQARVNAAAVGDTVRLPTCDVPWTGTVTIDKRIILEGNGAAANTILNRDPEEAATFFSAMIHVNGVTGFEMRYLTLDGTQDTDQNRWQEGGLRLQDCIDFRIHQNVFRDLAQGVLVQGNPTVQRGLIDHNTFTDNFCPTNCGGAGSLGYGVHVLGNGTYPALSLGTAQNVFIEQNTFGGATGNRHTVAANNGARYVFRNNTVTNHGPNAAIVDAHGDVTSWTTGTRQYEIYHNTLSDAAPGSQFAGIGPRGGGGVIFENTIAPMSSNRDIYLMNDYVKNGANTSDCPDPYPLPFQINDLYIWGNTRPDGVTPSTIVVAPACAAHIQNPRDFHTIARSGYTAYTFPHPGQGLGTPLADLTSGLRMHLKFDEGTGTTAQDSTVNNHDGTLANGATWGAPTMGTGALLLDGTNDEVQVNGLLSSPAALTLAAWVLPTSYGTGGADVISVGNVVMLRVTATEVRSHYWNGTAFSTMVAPRPAGGAWQHVAYTVTAGTQKLYVNGEDRATGSAGAAIGWTGQGTDTRIGTHANAGTVTRFGGLIDDARVYTRALSSADIAALAALEDPPPLSIQITTPTTGTSYSTTTALLATLGGVATDDTGVTGVTWNCPTCTTTSGPATCTPACGASATEVTWNIPSITLAPGTNLITVTATDASGARPDTLTVTYTPSTPIGAACTHYASSLAPTPPYVAGNSNNSGTSQGQPYLVVNFWGKGHATPGRVLCLLDGTYTGGNSLIHTPSTFVGTPSQPITIRALNDGKVLIDGGYGTIPVGLNGSYGVLEGVNIHGGDNITLSIAGDHWVVKRVVLWNNRPTNTTANVDNMLSMGGTNNVVEDCAVFGIGRKPLSAGPGKIGPGNNTLRRCWARFENKGYINPPGVGGPPTLGVELGYKQDNVLMENILTTREMTPGAQNTAPEPTFAVFMSDNSKVLGSISYVRPGVDFGAAGMFVTFGDLESGGEIYTTRNILYQDIVVYGQGYNIRPFQMNANTTNGHTITNLVGVSGLPPTCVAMGHNSCSNIRWGTTMTAAIGAGKSVWNEVPGICKRYVNGVLTTQPLWSGPGGTWPMNQRILDATVASGRAPVDITATMQSLLGPIPESCKSGAIPEVCTPPLVGTPPNCACPAGTVPPNCEPETPPITCPPDCPVQDVFVIATTGSPGPAGSDAAGVPCTLAAPCATIQRARSLMTPGDTLYLRGGTYTGAANRINTSTGPFPAGGTWSTATKIAGYAGETAILQQPSEVAMWFRNPSTDRFLIVDRLTCDGASTPGNNTQCLIVSHGAHHLRFQNLELRTSHFANATIENVNNVELLTSVVHGATHANGIDVGGTSDTILLDGNTVYGNGGHGVQASGSGLTNVTVKNSVSRNNTGTGFFLGATNLLATNLLAYANALGVRLTSSAVDGKLYHATVADNTGNEVQVDAGATNTRLTNVLAVGGIVDNGTTTVPTTNYTGDPGFIGGGNYHMALATSPAIDAGTCLPGVVDVALDGVARPQPPGGDCDIGVYEQAGSEDPMIPTPGPLSARPWGSKLFLNP